LLSPKKTNGRKKFGLLLERHPLVVAVGPFVPPGQLGAMGQIDSAQRKLQLMRFLSARLLAASAAVYSIETTSSILTIPF
jgi:hypothetical protein